MDDRFLPKKFFMTTGAGQSDTSEMNAFDNALMDAGISQCNLVKVSSILPGNCREIQGVKIEPGTITFVVLSRFDGKKGASISAGIGYAVTRKFLRCKNFVPQDKVILYPAVKNNEENEDECKDEYGIVAEDCGRKSEEKTRRDIQRKLRDMALSRGVEIERSEVRAEGLDVDLGFGCVIAALVYLF